MAPFEPDRTAAPEPSEVGDLVRLAGPLPAPPGDVAARVRASVHAEWRGATRRRRSRRLGLGIAVAVVVVAALGALASRLIVTAPPAATLEAVFVRGPVRTWIRGAASPDGPTLRPGERIAPGTEISSGPDGELVLRTPAGAEIRVATGSRLDVAASGVLALESGAIYVDSGDAGRGGDDGVRIDTRFGRVRDVGTRFEVRVTADMLRVRVRDGRVAIDRGGGGLDVGAGREVVLDADGRTAARDVPPDDPEWDWVARLATPPEIDGRPLDVLVRWAARERGLELRAADAETETAFREIRLSGSVGGLTPEESLDAVLPTCGLTRDVRDGVLVVAPAPPGAAR